MKKTFGVLTEVAVVETVVFGTVVVLLVVTVVSAVLLLAPQTALPPRALYMELRASGKPLVLGQMMLVMVLVVLVVSVSVVLVICVSVVVLVLDLILVLVLYLFPVMMEVTKLVITSVWAGIMDTTVVFLMAVVVVKLGLKEELSEIPVSEGR